MLFDFKSNNDEDIVSSKKKIKSKFNLFSFLKLRFLNQKTIHIWY